MDGLNADVLCTAVTQVLMFVCISMHVDMLISRCIVLLSLVMQPGRHASTGLHMSLHGRHMASQEAQQLRNSGAGPAGAKEPAGQASIANKGGSTGRKGQVAGKGRLKGSSSGAAGKRAASSSEEEQQGTSEAEADGEEEYEQADGEDSSEQEQAGRGGGGRGRSKSRSLPASKATASGRHMSSSQHEQDRKTPGGLGRAQGTLNTQVQMDGRKGSPSPQPPPRSLRNTESGTAAELALAQSEFQPL
jgi:hypothetical protein